MTGTDNNNATQKMKTLSRLVTILGGMEAGERAWALRQLGELFPAAAPVPGSLTGSGPSFAAR